MTTASLRRQAAYVCSFLLALPRSAYQKSRRVELWECPCSPICHEISASEKSLSEATIATSQVLRELKQGILNSLIVSVRPRVHR